MDFFQKIHQLQLVGELKLVIRVAEEKLIVCALLNDSNCGDKAQKHIKPLLFNGQPEQIDEVFFTHFGSAFKQTSTLLVSMDDYLKGVAKAEEESAKAKAEAKQVEKQKEELKKKFTDAMAKVDELEKEDKINEALAKLPDPLVYTDQAEIITKKREELRKKNNAPTLF